MLAINPKLSFIHKHRIWPILAFCIFSLSALAQTSESQGLHAFQKQIAALEKTTEGKIGVYAINLGHQTHLEYRAQKRFPMGCTSKVMGVAAILRKSMDKPSLLTKPITYTKKDLTSWSPITSQHLNHGMNVSNLCAAAIRYSDNTAMNLLVKELGGLDAINVFARSIHNPSFRQDHDWPKEAFSGGLKNIMDSSTPKDMAESLYKILFTHVLDKPQRNDLRHWLKNNTTGNFRIRAGVPKRWVVADKTGTGSEYGTTNDIGVIWPPHGAPMILAVYYTSDDPNAIKREDIIAKVTTLVINQWAYDKTHFRQKN